MTISPLAGLPAPQSLLIDPASLVAAYMVQRPDIDDPTQLVSFGTSGHRGSSMSATFTEAHILAITQAICDYRLAQGIDGPLVMGKDTHALSAPAEDTAIEVLAANGVETIIQLERGFTPTPVVSHAILTRNRGRTTGLADGIVITPSHNPPADGGFKYNPINGGPADTDVTKWIEARANALLRDRNQAVKRMSIERALGAPTTHPTDLIQPYVDDLDQVIDMEQIRASGIRLGVDPLGGASAPYWEPIARRWGLDIDIVNPAIDPTFSFMTVDHDGKIRMDCSSPYAMAPLIALRDRFDVAFGNDTDADRHGIVTRSAGLMNPNHYLAVAIDYLFRHRPGWGGAAGVGKTVVSSGLIDRVAARLGRGLVEVPVGFKWFVDGLAGGALGFGGEESAGAAFLRMDGTVWTTDKDGLILGLLAAEITARTGKDPGLAYAGIAEALGTPFYARVDAPANAGQRQVLKSLSAESLQLGSLAGEAVTGRFTVAPGNGAAIGGVKVTSANGWFAVRPSGTEDTYKIYAESFLSAAHLGEIQAEAKAAVAEVLK